jgi:hypothetical protein
VKSTGVERIDLCPLRGLVSQLYDYQNLGLGILLPDSDRDRRRRVAGKTRWSFPIEIALIGIPFAVCIGRKISVLVLCSPAFLSESPQRPLRVKQLLKRIYRREKAEVCAEWSGTFWPHCLLLDSRLAGE